jgi:hypothetical protein
MLNFIQNQTNWYKEKQKALEEVRVKILKETAQGRYRLALRREKAFTFAKSITSMANEIARHFNPNHFETPEVKKANEILIQLEKLIAADVSFRRKQVYPSGGYQPNQSPFINNNEFIINPKQTKKQ